MALPRFALVEGRLRQGVASWPGPDSVTEGFEGGRWFAWRLLGGNNRELGRSAGVFATRAAAHTAALSARAVGTEVMTALATDARSSMWRWVVTHDASPIAVSSRLYLRQRECQYSLAQFLRCLGPAVLTTEPEADPPVSLVLPELERPVIDLRSDTTAGERPSAGGLPLELPMDQPPIIEASTLLAAR